MPEATRSVPGSKKWLLEQITSGFAKVATECLSTLADQVVLRDCEFFAFQDIRDPDELHGQEIQDNHFAGVLGRLALRNVANREIRLSYLVRCWPNRLLLLNLGEPLVTDTIGEFKKDWDLYSKYKDLNPMPPIVKRIIDSSNFQLTETKQWVAGMIQKNWQSHKDLLTLADRRLSDPISSLACEELVGVAKNGKIIKGSKKFKKPNRAMGLALGRRILDKRFKYKIVSTSTPVKKCILKPCDFGRGKLRKTSIDFTKIASNKAKAFFYSPGPDAAGLPAMECAVLREVDRFKSIDKLKDLRLGRFADIDHLIAIRRKSKVALAFDWVIPVHHYKSSGIVAYPIDFVKFPGSSNQYVEFHRNVRDYVYIPIMDWSEIQAAKVC